MPRPRTLLTVTAVVVAAAVAVGAVAYATFRPPAEFTYLIWGFTAPQRLAVQHGTASFVTTSLDDDTIRVRWTYSLLPTSSVVTPFVERYVDDSPAPMMRATLAGMRDGAEADLAS